MSTSSVPKLQFTAAGVVIPPETEVYAGVMTDIDAAFGGGVGQNKETAQGQLATSQSAVIGDKNNEVAYVVNQVDPQYSSGRFQDAIARIYFLTRKPALPTTVIATLIGVPGSTVPVGSLAQDTVGNIYASVGEVTFTASGTLDVEFQNIVTGPIPCPAGTLSRVYQSVSGWDAITNAADGILGRVVESRYDFELRRKNSVAVNANGTAGAIYGLVFNVDNVLDVYVIENRTGGVVNKGSTNYPMLAHSVFIAVVGGTDADVAAAIRSKKDLGCDMNGNTTVVVADTSGYSYPYPTYDMLFNRNAALPIKFEVSIVDDPNLPADIDDLIKAAIIARFNGTDETAREKIASTILASRYYSAVALTSSVVQTLSIKIGTTAPTLDILPTGIDQYPTITETDITIVRL